MSDHGHDYSGGAAKCLRCTAIKAVWDTMDATTRAAHPCPGTPPQQADHHCHAHLCPVEVPPAMFTCRRHWFMLPKAMRDAVWREYQPGQEERKVAPTDEYMRVTDEAIIYLAQKEGKFASLPTFLRQMAVGPRTKLEAGS